MRIHVYPKLAWEGIRKNKRIYAPYIFMGALMTMMYYILSFLKESPVLEKMRGASVLAMALPLGCTVIVIFSLVFLFYTNSFLIRQRYREFGLYNILGMNKQNVCMIMAWESVFVGGISILSGLAAGILLSKGAELVLLNILHLDVSFEMRIGMTSFVQTVCIYLGIYFILLLNAVVRVWFSKPLDLLKSSKVGEKMPKRTWIYAAAGVISLGAAYYLAVAIKEPLTALSLFFIAVILVIFGTYVLFMAGSIVLCRILQKNKRYYYKANHFVSVSSMMYRMRRNGAGLASICILLTMVLVMLSSTMSLYIGIEDSLKSRYPSGINVEIGISSADDVNKENIGRLYQIVHDNCPEVKESDQHTVAAISGLFTKSGITVDLEALDNFLPGDYDQVGTLQAVSLEEYNRLCNADETLADGECFLYSDRIRYESDTFSVQNGPGYRVKKILDAGISDGEMNAMTNPSMLLVVKDFESYIREMSAFKMENGQQMLSLQWQCGFDAKTVEQETSEVKALSDAFSLASEKEEIDGFSYYSVSGREENREGFYDLNGSLLFLGIMLSIVFLFAAVMIIYYKQLSEGYEDYTRYEIMQKVGMTRQDIRKSINSQMLTVFFSPLLMAGLHLCFAFPFLWKILMMFGLNNKGLIVWVMIGCYIVFGLFYTIVYKVTSNLYFHIVSGQKRE